MDSADIWRIYCPFSSLTTRDVDFSCPLGFFVLLYLVLSVYIVVVDTSSPGGRTVEKEFHCTVQLCVSLSIWGRLSHLESYKSPVSSLTGISSWSAGITTMTTV